jgi:hypothetical protein
LDTEFEELNKVGNTLKASWVISFAVLAKLERMREASRRVLLIFFRVDGFVTWCVGPHLKEVEYLTP